MAIMLGSRDSRINLEANIGLGLLTGQQAFARYVALGGCDPAQTITSQMPDTESDGTVTTLQEAGGCAPGGGARYYAIDGGGHRSEEHTSELQSLMRITYAVFCLNKTKKRV